MYPDTLNPANTGDAKYWATNAGYNGWTVTSTPRVDSIAVFQPGVNGADPPSGHVAWVTAVPALRSLSQRWTLEVARRPADSARLTPAR